MNLKYCSYCKNIEEHNYLGFCKNCNQLNIKNNKLGIKLNKKGSLISGWTEGIILSVLIVLMLTIIITNMNSLYSKNYDLGLGTNTTYNKFVNAQDTLSQKVSGGEATFTNDGLNILTSWDIIKTVVSILWDFITGGWIETITAYIGLPISVALIFRMLYFISLIFGLIYVWFKVFP